MPECQSLSFSEISAPKRFRLSLGRGCSTWRKSRTPTPPRATLSMQRDHSTIATALISTCFRHTSPIPKECSHDVLDHCCLRTAKYTAPRIILTRCSASHIGTSSVPELRCTYGMMLHCCTTAPRHHSSHLRQLNKLVVYKQTFRPKSYNFKHLYDLLRPPNYSHF
jgi:hypothetical protein